MKSNLYWPIYKNLEREVLDLSNLVHFDDHQLSVYSVKIAELLIRCSVEIESISKDLYLAEGGEQSTDQDLYFDTDCLKMLDEKWLLSKKVVILSYPNFHFREEKNQILRPLHKASKRGSSGANWKKAYQAVKHERAKSLPRGNVGNLLQALAALFILNLYFKDEAVDMGNDIKAASFPINCGSSLFSVKLHKWAGNAANGSYYRKDDFNECIYISKWNSKTETDMKAAIEEMQRKNIEHALQHPKMISWLQNNKIEEYKGSSLLWEVLGKEDYSKMLANSSQPMAKASKAAEYEATLNKQNIA